VLVTTPPNLDQPRNPRIERYNEGLRELAGQEFNAVLADVYQGLWQQRELTLMQDGTHLTDEGHRIIADAVLAALSADWQTAGPDKAPQF
jgi:lysophospholipase L1-like esterase